MTTEVVSAITNQSPDELAAIVRQILGEDATPIGELTATKIGRSVGQGTVGIFRVSGRARSSAGDTVWSAVVKALGEPETVVKGVDERDVWREMEAYGSGAFAEPRGVRSAHCYAIQERPEMALLWLEDLSAAEKQIWERDQFVVAARDFGRFNAHWPEDALPEWEWLDRRSYRDAIASFYTSMARRVQDNMGQPPMRPFAAYRDKAQQLWGNAMILLKRVESTSRGVCHRDSHPKNLFPVTGETGDHVTVAIDWARVGIDALGMDAGQILGSTMMWLEVSRDGAASLRDPVFDAYLAGLAESGWSGSEAGVRLSYLSRLVFEGGRQLCLVSHAIDDAGFGRITEELFGRPLHERIEGYAAYMDFYLDCLAEAQQLAAQG